jgi:uncharacterized protein
MQLGCEYGSFIACSLLAGRYIRGDGVEKDEATGVALLDRACAGRQGSACHVLGAAYLEPALGLAQDLAQGATLVQAGCDLGDRASCSTWAMCLHKGRGVAKNSTHAAQVLEAQCALGNSDGCLKLGAVAYDEGDKGKALESLQRACTLGHQLGCDGVKLMASAP